MAKIVRKFKAAHFRKLSVKPRTNELVLTAAVIDRMIKNSRFLKAFPFLMAERGKRMISCKPCKRRAAAMKTKPIVDYKSIKAQLAALPVVEQQKLKAMLQTRQLKIMSKTGQTVETKVI